MDTLFTLTGSRRHQDSVDEWLAGEPIELFSIARHWFRKFRDCGDDVLELIHDGCPTACVDSAALGYVNVFKTHVNVGFYRGALLPDPNGLLEGTGKRMRHVKIRPGFPLNTVAMEALIASAYRNIKARHP